MPITEFIHSMPKVELHVHLEGSIRPSTLLELSWRNNIPLPARSLEELERWYVFTDFPHFAEVYQTLSRCICNAEDIELIARDFLAGQAEQNVVYSEVTYTALTHYRNSGIAFETQLEALYRARAWAEAEHGVSMGLVIDIPREFCTPQEAETIADWVIAHQGDGPLAFGMGGYEVGVMPDVFAKAFAKARKASVPIVLHAGETEGPVSIWGALEQGSLRIGHGVRCLEDPKLVEHLRQQQVPLEVCPSSNVCLRVFPDLESHPIKKLMDQGLYITLNTDDPPMFNTDLNQEYLKVSQTFGLSAAELKQLSLNALRASLLPDSQKQAMEGRFMAQFAELQY